MDVKSFFLSGVIKEEIYVKQLKSFEYTHFLDHMIQLKKTFYGLHASPAWYE